MPMPKAQLKGFLSELAKLGDKPVAKALNKIVFQASDDEVMADHPEMLQGPPVAASNKGQADQGNGQATNLIGNSQMVSPAHGPGGV